MLLKLRSLLATLTVKLMIKIKHKTDYRMKFDNQLLWIAHKDRYHLTLTFNITVLQVVFVEPIGKSSQCCYSVSFVTTVMISRAIFRRVYINSITREGVKNSYYTYLIVLFY